MYALIGTVQPDFRPPVFSSFEPVWVTDQWVKIFSILVEISLRNSNFSVEKSDSPGYHTVGKLTYLGKLCFGGFFIDSPGYDTLGRLTRRGMIPWGD